MTTALIDFLKARIAEDEADATCAARGGPEWTHREEEYFTWGVYRGPNSNGNWDAVTLDHEGLSDSVHEDDGPHIARWDPARVLNECKAKRRIIALHESWPVLAEGPDELFVGHGLDGTMTARMTHKVVWLTTAAYRATFGDEPPTSPVLAALAAAYADHPDYDEGWRP